MDLPKTAETEIAATYLFRFVFVQTGSGFVGTNSHQIISVTRTIARTNSRQHKSSARIVCWTIYVFSKKGLSYQPENAFTVRRPLSPQNESGNYKNGSVNYNKFEYWQNATAF